MLFLMSKIFLGIILLFLFLAVLYSHRVSLRLRRRPAMAAAYGSVSAIRADFWAGLCLLLAGSSIVVACWLHFSYALADLTRDSSAPALFFLLDCSASMLADGVTSSRLDEARSLIADLADRHPHLPCGLITFAGNAMLDFPPSSGGGGFADALAAAQPDLGFIPGSSPGGAIRLAQATADAVNLNPVLILLSDGEINVTDLAAEHSLWATRSEPILMIVVGELERPRPIPWQGAWMIDPDTGQEAKSRATASQLTALAEISPAAWQMLANPNQAMATRYLQSLLKAEKKNLRTQRPLRLSKVAIFFSLTLLVAWLMTKQGLLKLASVRSLPKPTVSAMTICLLLGITIMTAAATAETAEQAEEEIIQQLQNVKLPSAERARLLSNWAALLIKRATTEQSQEAACAQVSEAVALCREALRLLPEMKTAKINLTAARQTLHTLTAQPAEQMEMPAGQTAGKDNAADSSAEQEPRPEKPKQTMPLTREAQSQAESASIEIEEDSDTSEIKDAAGSFSSDGGGTWRQMQKRRQVIPGRQAGVKPW